MKPETNTGQTGLSIDTESGKTGTGQRVVPANKRFNELDGQKWTRYSMSVWNDISKNADEKKLKHPAVFPIELAKRVIEIFTKTGETVLDPFVGTGATLLAAKELNRNAIGVDIVEEYTRITKERLAKANALFGIEDGLNIEVICGDARYIDDIVKPASADLVFTSPPYWDILNRKRTADGKETRDYEMGYGNLALVNDYARFIKGLTQAFAKIIRVLKADKYCVVNVMDLRKQDRFYAYHMDLAIALKGIGFVLEDIIVWNRSREYSNLRPLGYPYRFRVNKVHEYLMIFRKPPEAEI
jgi:DNA modification methylase